MLEFVRYEFEPPKYDVDECRQRGMTYAAPLKVTLRLIVFDIDEETGAKSVKDIKEQDVYMGDIPLMTKDAPSSASSGPERDRLQMQLRFARCAVFDHAAGRSVAGRQPAVRRAGHSCIAAPGSISNSTPRTSCSPASTAAARFR